MGVQAGLTPAAITKVKATGGFWFDRIETNRLVTLKSDFAKCNETPRIANFTNAARRAIGTFGGIPFDDSDVYKVMEGAAYILATDPTNKELRSYMDWLIGQMARAQELDGYLYTARTLGYFALNHTNKLWSVGMMGPTRWSNLASSHELYNVGHMYEAAVAWYEATGATNFLNIACKNADLLCRTFGMERNQLKATSGHEEIELALFKLARVTGEKKYEELAKFFLEMRGAKKFRKTWRGADLQDHLPVKEQDEAVGHAVRAAYLYCGMCDAGGYEGALEKLWRNVVGCKLHLNGGIGAGKTTQHHKWGECHEAFGENYFLPNEDAYLETCAAIANCLWNERMFLKSGEARFGDVMERTLLNGFVSGISLSGDEFFYPNPLASKGGYKRSKWFSCSCCPVNDVRFLPQVPSFAYATDGRDIFVNLFMQSEVEINGVKLRQDTNYPWSGKVRFTVTGLAEGAKKEFTLKVRVPCWARGCPVPSDLYYYEGVAADSKAEEWRCWTKNWQVGDSVEVEFAMPVRRVKANMKVEADRGRVAIERGPILYCLEAHDNKGDVFNAVLPPDATFTDTSITIGDKVFPALKASNGLIFIPYCLWNNRTPGNAMQVWLNENN